MAFQVIDILGRQIERKREFRLALARAREVGRPLLVVGLPQGDPYGCGYPEEGDVVLYLHSDTSQCSNQVQGSVEDLSRWPDGHFAVAFVSHVLEHACDPHRALDELQRVAGEIVLLYPPWWALSAWVVPGHAWLIHGSGTGTVALTRLRDRCNVPTYFGGDWTRRDGWATGPLQR